MNAKTETQEKEIQLVQVPKIVHRLREVGARVTERLKELDLENLVATEDTLRFLKELRAELNKELDYWEGLRKFVKTGVLTPYNNFEAEYKIEISDKYKGGNDILKTKIEVVENKVKAKKRELIQVYFNELCQAENIDFVLFEKAVPEVNLSITEKKYKEQVAEFVTKVQDDLNLIRTEEYQPEILAEYKKSLNASQAITAVRTRKEAEKTEAAAIKIAETARRTKEVVDAGMIWDEMTQVYVYNDEIWMSKVFVSDATKEDFNATLAVRKEQIRQDNASDTAQAEMSFGAPAPAVSAPTVKKGEDLVKASFEVTGTMAQLRALGQFMRDNHITYKNIE